MAVKLAFLNKRSKGFTFFIGLILVATIGYIDYLTGDYSLLVFYSIPLALVGWYVGWWQGIAIAVLCGTGRYLTYHTFIAEKSLLYWNSVMDTVFLIMVVLMIFALRKALEK